MDQRKMVLLADASEEFRTLLREEIEKTGEFSVEVARDGNEVLKKTEERDDPDLRLCLRSDADGGLRAWGGVFPAEAF